MSNKYKCIRCNTNFLAHPLLIRHVCKYKKKLCTLCPKYYSGPGCNYNTNLIENKYSNKTIILRCCTSCITNKFR